MTKIADGSVWRYKDTDYRVNSVMPRNLIQYRDEWRPTVRYTREPPCGLVFYRSDTEFAEKFERIDR